MANVSSYKKFPIKKNELSRFISISLMMVCILFIYSIQRTVKDTIVVSYMGAELISTIKLYGVLPSAILMMICYSKLSDLFQKTQVFHILNAFFIFYFIAFTFVISPNIDLFHFSLNSFKEALPNLKYLFVMFEKWTYSLYYILAELWGSVMLSLMFWQITNQVFKIEEAKRLYPLFGLVGQIGMLMSGEMTRFFTSQKSFSGSWQESLSYINLSVLFTGIVLSCAFFVLSEKIMDAGTINSLIDKKNKKKIKFIEGIKNVLRSKYIGLITLVVVCYGISINLVEGVWKAQAQILYTSPKDYARFMSNLQTYTGLATMFSTLSGSYLLSKLSWKISALITPFIVLVTGGFFFLFSLYQSQISYLIPLSFSPVFVAVFFGLLQNILSKSTKYAFFDATKEMAYIPLDGELKSKGKAAADVIGSRLGKSGGAFIQWIILAMIPGSTLLSISKFVFFIFIFIMFLWIFSTRKLSLEFSKLEK